MKRILSILVTTLILNCSKKEYKLTYVVFYPDNPDTVTLISNSGFNYESSEGVNYIIERTAVSSKIMYKNMAPYKILSYTTREIK